ncbi:uncharacterized protein ATNIH1004_004382 [Aspergillus tanneri]|uniref:Uncharacterized protein n=1 Tax=Aspergillus tanneri TaxID=1220188 RepID=A0A5M9N1P8_9EURO|nr:uncharacterized protein ATNIH1004_004382 [Aspergillus tanneri]KAA8648497.1 hypothetical protein ATNIH1004_004382 [Aspergillus tanneri]
MSIIVDEAPDFVRPYVLPKYKGRAVTLTMSQTIRFSITANSSDGAFSLIQHNGKASGFLSGTIHIFQLVDPDSQLTHAFHPGGFENLFNIFSKGNYDTHGVSSPYIPTTDDSSTFGPMAPEEYNLLVSLDLYAASEEEFIPRRDFVNGTAGDGETKQSWHNGPNTLPDNPTTPYFIAKDYGPKYLNTDIGYKVIQPLTTAAQTEGELYHGDYYYVA